MTILAIIQTAAKRLGLNTPSTVVGNTDNNVVLLKALLEQTAQDLGSDYPWGELQKEYTFTLSTSTESYVLPGDYDRKQNETLWNRTQHWPLIGPIDAVLWQQYKSGLITTLPRQRFRLKGWKTNQFFIDPTPSSSDNGQTCVYEYISSTVFRPKFWTTGTVFAASSYCSYNGNIYQTSAGGTTGATPPTWTSGTSSDGAVNWTYISAGYTTIIADTDEAILDNPCMVDGIVWRFKRERGLEYASFKADAEEQIDAAKTKLIGAGVTSLNTNWGLPWAIGFPYSYPEGNY